ncbi:hypothetical protein ACLQ2D_35825 [Streptomyces sp. DT199]|uniref:hypothetical protein n=1 Tax=Streptomyces sp. DT199 TaxID=3393421 RepID=UPI003CE747B5
MGLGVSSACAIGALVAGVGVVATALPGRPEPWPVQLLPRAAAVYAPGFSTVLASEQAFGDGADSAPAPACRDGFDEATREGLSPHRSSYLPLRLDCVRDDGSVCSSDSDYGWMNGTSAALALSAALLFIGAGYATEPRARKAATVS